MPIDIENDDLHTALKKLRARERTFEQLEEMTKLGSWEIDLNTKKSTWSKQSYLNYGYEPFSIEPTLELSLSHLVEEDAIRARQLLTEIIGKKEITNFLCTLRKVSGEMIDLQLQMQTLHDENDNPSKIIGTAQDVTQRLELERHSRELSQLVEQSSSELYIVEYFTFKYLYVNIGACDALGYSKEELLNMTARDINPFLTDLEIQDLKRVLEAQKKLVYRSIHKKKDSSTYHVQSYVHTMKYQGKDAYVIFDTDITQQIEDEKLLKLQSEQLTHQAHHDALTKLPNRTLFKDRLSQTIITAKHHNSKFALFFIDLDNFKNINDSLGHHIGDEVLIEVAKRLQLCVNEEDTIARLGGDEFTVILKSSHSLQDISSISQKILNSIRKPIDIELHSLYITTSIGVSLYPKDATTNHDLIKFADTAMYKAKDEGRDNYQFYASEMTAFAFERVMMESNLRVAIKEEQFIVYYQPQINALTDKIVGMEALVRWMHPELGLITPAKFIPIAEESGLIIEIDRIVMNQAFAQFSSWYAKGLKPGKLSLNLAMKQLNTKDFISHLMTTMNTMSFKPIWLELEVTESEVMDNPEVSIEKLMTIHKIGIDIAIDDFGTGYSSLSYLKKLPLDKLKIDQSFVRDLPDDEDDIAITRAIIAIGKSLNLNLIAEGVETREQRDFLIENGCELIQGYFYSKPIPAQEMQKLFLAN